VADERELLERTVHARYPVEGRPDLEATVRLAAIDTGGGKTPDGSRTSQVYQLVRRTPRLLAIKGVAQLEDDQAEDGDPLDAPWRESAA
jgi:hypothetical protein